MQGRFKMEYRLFTIVRYNYNYRDYEYNNHNMTQLDDEKEKENTKPILGWEHRKTNFFGYEQKVNFIWNNENIGLGR